MKNQLQIELEKMALSAELARQVAHDSGNFLYNLLLQLEIDERIGAKDPSVWANIRDEAKHLARRLQDWHHHGVEFPREKQRFELNILIRETLTELLPDRKIELQGSATPISLTSFPRDVKSLCCFLTLIASRIGSGSNSALSIHTEEKTETIVFRIRGMQAAHSALSGFEGVDWDDSKPSSLLVDSCKSIAIRLDAKIRVEKDTDGSVALTVEFPVNLS